MTSSFLNKILPLFFFGFLCLGAASSPSHEERPRLQPVLKVEKNPFYKSLLDINPDTSLYEKQRIDYLLSRITRSTNIFIRNAEEYTGKTAASHMRGKYRKYRTEVQTAEDFIRAIASRSRISRDDYKIKIGKKTYPSSEILLYELEMLDRALAQAREKRASETGNTP
jgi:hypothetical protein